MVPATLKAAQLGPPGASAVREARPGLAARCCVERMSPAGVGLLGTEEFHRKEIYFLAVFFT